MPIFNTEYKASDPIKWNGDLTKATVGNSQTLSGFIAYGLAFSEDGTNLYYTETKDYNPGKLHQYSLGTPWDITTKSASIINTMTFGAANPRYGVYCGSILFRNNGQYLYLSYFNNTGSQTAYIDQFTLSTPRDISTATLTNQVSLGAKDRTFAYLTDDGTKFWYSTNGTNGGMFYKELTTPYIIESGTNISNTNLRIKYVSFDGNYYYDAQSNGVVTQYSLPSSFDFTSSTQVATTAGLSSQYNQGVTFNKDGTKMFVLGGNLNTPTIYEYSISS